MRIASRFVVVLVVTAAFLTGTAALSSRDDITLQTDAETYCLGDTVCFTLDNSSTDTLWLSCMPAWTIWDDSADSLIFPLYVLWIYWGLPPDSAQTYEWDQRDYHLNQVPAGTYYVTVTGAVGTTSVTVADTFDITSSTAAAPESWSKVKANWR